jgi:hypothetical protein
VGAKVRRISRIEMKRTTAPASKQDALARKRALIRALIEQHGWSSTPAPATSRDGSHPSGEARPANIIPFPTFGK